MMAVEQPQPIQRSKSLFRRFTRKEQRPVHPLALPIPPTPPSPPSSIESQPRTPRKLQRRVSVSQPTPPESPKYRQHIHKSSIGKPQLITHIHHFQIPESHPPTAQTTHKPHHARHDSAHDDHDHDSSLPPTPPRRILPTTLPALPFSSPPSITPWDVFLPPSQVHALYLGHMPTLPSDKWFVYSEGPDALGKLKVHFHRSWTGMKIAELFVVMDVKGEGAGKVVGIKWNAGWETNCMCLGEAKFAIRGAADEMGFVLEDGRYI